MNNLKNDQEQQSPKKKPRGTLFEYGAIFALVSVTLVVTAQLTDQSGFGAMNAMNAVSLNAVSDTAISSSPFKAD
ncbi:MAG: hypothetical protein JKY27_13465 [Magnetovibrio sp.]|nr:hypothetical protein [Magnetovibrio sp.]